MSTRSHVRFLALLGALAISLTVGSAAYAGAPRIQSALMPLGAVVQTPRGFADFCRREQGECPWVPEISPELHTLPGQDAQWAAIFAATEPAAMREPAQGSWSRPRGYRFGGDDFDYLTDAVSEADTERFQHAVTLDEATWKVLNDVNQGVNRRIRMRSDRETYGASDYWAIPLTHGSRLGDCEDYVMQKRHALRELGFTDQQLSIAIVRTAWNESHAVLLVGTDRGEIVLDNLSPRIYAWTASKYRWIARQSPLDPMTWVAGPRS